MGDSTQAQTHYSHNLPCLEQGPDARNYSLDSSNDVSQNYFYMINQGINPWDMIYLWIYNVIVCHCFVFYLFHIIDGTIRIYNDNII